MFIASPPASARRFGLTIGDAALLPSSSLEISQRAKGRKTATERREAHGVRGACSRFGARWVARNRQQAGRTPDASRGSPAGRHSRSGPQASPSAEICRNALAGSSQGVSFGVLWMAFIDGVNQLGAGPSPPVPCQCERGPKVRV